MIMCMLNHKATNQPGCSTRVDPTLTAVLPATCLRIAIGVEPQNNSVLCLSIQQLAEDRCCCPTAASSSKTVPVLQPLTYILSLARAVVTSPDGLLQGHATVLTCNNNWLAPPY